MVQERTPPRLRKQLLPRRQNRLLPKLRRRRKNSAAQPQLQRKIERSIDRQEEGETWLTNQLSKARELRLPANRAKVVDVQADGPAAAPVANNGKYFRRKKVCKFCVEKIDGIDYKDYRLLSQFIAESGKIVPRRLSGVCTPHQRRLGRAIKVARNIALLPFAGSSR